MSDFYHAIHEARTPYPRDVSGASSVTRDWPTGISVLIAGAGVAGLTAALECYRKGHNVRIFERAPCMTTAGDMFTIGLSARRWIFDHWPEMKEELDQIGMPDGYQTIRQHTGKEIQKPVPFLQALSRGMSINSYSELPMCHHLRPLFHRMLYNQIQKLGIEISYNKRIVDYFESDAAGIGGVIMADGEVATADVIIAADGIGSKSQLKVNGGIEEARSSGKSVYRASLPTRFALADPLVKEHYGLHEGKHPIFRVHVGPSTHAMTLTREDIMCWTITYSSEEDGPESWHNIVSKEQVLRTMEQYPGYSEALKALVRLTPPDRIINWPLIWRNPQPQWTSPGGHIVQIGDAAHSFLPASGNGASQAIEDGVSIAACLALGGKSNIPLSLKVHNKLRFERVSNAQKLGFANAEILGHTKQAGPPPAPACATNSNSSSATTVSPSLTPSDSISPPTDPKPDSAASPVPKGALKSPAGRPMHPKWIFMHNPEKYALENYDACAKSITEGTEFVNTNVPPGSTFTPWTLAEIIEDAKNGKAVHLEGDWS